MQTAAHRRESSEEISAELAQFDHLYREAESGTGASAARETELPDGEYLAVVEQVDLTRSRTSGVSSFESARSAGITCTWLPSLL